MEFFNQNKQNQKGIERFILFIYSLYCVYIGADSIRMGWPLWILGTILATLVVSWSLFFSQYKNYRTRAISTTLLMQLTIILYGANKEELLTVVPVFMCLTVLVAIYGLTELMWLTAASAVFVIFYHGVITDTFAVASREWILSLLPQLGNIICLELVVYIWVKKRNESTGQIYKIIEALIDAEQSKDDFLSNVSHEIRTPVNTICGMSEMALREADFDKMRDEVYDIQDAGRNLMSLVSDILDFAQLQQGKMNLEEEAYNITSTINDIINMSMARRGDKPIELIVDCAADIPCSLLGDEKKIRRVIMNLVDNAIKFTSEGCVGIQVNARKETYGINLCVTVTDTGIGMSQDSMEKLFESFSQVDTRRNRQKGGVGLGLAISKALVQKMGGTITVRSRLGKGSILRFVVPQKVLNNEPIVHVKNREAIHAATYFNLEKFGMSAIRDEYTNNIYHMIQNLQVKCHVCRNLAELKRRVSHEKFTHIFIGLKEYREDESYFDDLAQNNRIIVVIDRSEEKYLSNPDLLRMYKPLNLLPVVSILNGTRGSVGTQMVRQNKFTAPTAHVLVVDDNRMNIRVVEGLLKEYQIKVSSAISGQEALEMIENMSYDFVFMDHMMPEMDGIETLHRIRDKVGHYYQKVPIIALTANAAPGNREMFLEEGFDDFVAKPVELSVLERVLRRNLPEEKLIFQPPDDGEALEIVPEKVSQEEAVHEPEPVEEIDSPQGEVVLEIGDLDVKTGLMYCGGRQPYLDILKMCCEEGEQNRQNLQDLYETKNWKDYTIKVHALKSTMLSIGAHSLSEKAKALELAGKQENTAYIIQYHNPMMEEYLQVIEMLEQCPLLYPQQPAAGDEIVEENGQTVTKDCPELGEEAFDEMVKELEDAVYSFDEKRMLAIVSKMQEYRYGNTPLEKALQPVRTKIEKADYMSGFDYVQQIRNRLQKEKEGGNTGC